MIAKPKPKSLYKAGYYSYLIKFYTAKRNLELGYKSDDNVSQSRSYVQRNGKWFLSETKFYLDTDEDWKRIVEREAAIAEEAEKGRSAS